jgi:ribosomal protein S18 acetylase RimI-like enzyme
VSLNITIREACDSDLFILVEYNLALARETENLSLDTKVLRLGIQTALNLENCHYFVAEIDGGNVVGQTMITSEWSDWRNSQMWWIQSVYVHPDYRKQGVFRRIFTHIETISTKSHLVKSLRLYVMKNNLVGIDTYVNLGMNNSGYLVYEKTLFPTIEPAFSNKNLSD